jgi:hypothetical protein
MDVWQRQRSLARSTVGWGGASMVAGLALALRRNPWWRAFGLQTAGWGAVDLGIAVLAGRLQDRRMRRSPDPYAPVALEAERVALRRVLLVNAVADAGYVVLGAVLARDARPRVAGAGVAVMVQGAFLLLHDSHHAWRARAPHRTG